jgi:DNA-binding MarR family transcriptional regulator
MGEILKRRLKQGRFQSLEQETLLNLIVAGNFVRDLLDQACGDFGITHQQYNVLRILRGGQPDGYPRGEVTERMFDRAPDVTRLIDRLERQGFVERVRTEQDRRLSITRITRKGLDLLDRMQARILEFEQYIADRLSPDECRELSTLCEKIYADSLQDGSKPD